MNFIKNMSIYTLTAMLNSAVPFLLLPVFTAYLSPIDYGVLATFTTIIAFLSPLIILGISSLVGIDFFKLSQEDLARHFGTMILLPIVASIILMLFIGLFDEFIAKYFDIPVQWLMILPMFTLLTFLPQTLSIIYRSQHKPLYFASLEISQTLMHVGLSVWLVVGIGLSWQGRMYSMLVTGIIFSMIAFFLIYRMGYFKFNFSFEIIKSSLKFGLGLIPHSVGNLAIRMSDRLFIVAIIGLSEAGQYAVGVQVASIMLILVSTFNQAWGPFLFQNLSSITEDKKTMLVKYSYYVMGGFLIVAILLNVISPVIYHFFINEQFHESIKFILWMSVGFFFTAVYLTFVDYIFYEKKTHILSMITLFNVSLNLVMNYLFINKYGAIGATYAYAISMFFVMCLAWFLSNKIYPMPWFYWLKRGLNVK